MKLSGTDDRHYRWIVVAACFLMAFTGLGFCSGTKSLFLVPVTEATGLKRSLFSLSDSCRYITTTVVNLFFGAQLAKYGARKLIAAGYLCLIAFTLIYAHASSAWVFCIGGVCLGLGLSWMGTAMIGHVISAWFRENRGTVMGFALAANGVGGAVATQIVSPIINRPGDAFGYRRAYLLMAMLLAVAGVLVLVFFREFPSGGKPAAAGKRRRGERWSGLTAKQAMATPYFYAAALCVFLTGMSLQSVSGISAAHMRDVGLDSAFIAGVVSIHSVTLSLAKLLVGFLHDRIRLRRTLTLCCLAAIAAIALLLGAGPDSGKWSAAVYGPMMSLALPMETIIIPLLAADLFGDREFEKLLGIFVSVSTAGFAVGVPLSNLCHDLLGSYRPALMATACVMAAVTTAYQFILRAAQRKRAAIEAEEAA